MPPIKGHPLGFQGTRFGSNERAAEAGGIGIRILILKGALGLHPGAASLPAQTGFPRACFPVRLPGLF